MKLYQITPRYHVISLSINVRHAALIRAPMMMTLPHALMALPHAQMMMTLPLLDYLPQPPPTQTPRLETSFMHHHPSRLLIISVILHSGLLSLPNLPPSPLQRSIFSRSLSPHFLLPSPLTFPRGGSRKTGMTPTALSSASFLIDSSRSPNGL